MKKKLVKNIASSAVLSAIMSVLLLFSAKSGKILAFLIFCLTICLNWFGILRQRKGEAVGMPILRLVISMAIEMYFIYKLEPHIIHRQINSSGIKMIFWVLLCFILPLLLNISTVIGYNIVANIKGSSKKH